MVIWGGYNNGLLNTGARYDPISNTWQTTSTGTGCPSARIYHTAVWTGTEMIVWGGEVPFTNTGGRYHPSSDSWAAMSIGASCPLARYLHTAIWTGAEMIVWGGGNYSEENGFQLLNTGGRYAPATDSWAPTPTAGFCPFHRESHMAVWTGTEMIIWGGDSITGTGGVLYFPFVPVPTVTGSTSGCVSPGVLLSTQPYSAYQWNLNDLPISGATFQTYTAIQSGTYTVMVTDAFGCSGTSEGKSLTIYPNPSPSITGANSNTCPATSVALNTGVYAGYQWQFGGNSIAGATSQTYNATVTGIYRITVTDPNGCVGTSANKNITVNFCPASEVSPAGCVFPLKFTKDSSSSTGYCLYFQKMGGTTGYNIYSGTIGSWYSHSGAIGRVCNAATTDLGTGQLRASVTPPSGNRYYLITAHNATVEGPSGYASSGTQIPASQSTCPP